MNVQFLSNIILTLAILFLFFGLLLVVVRGLMGRTNVDTLYGVGRQKSRQVQFQESITGLVVTLFGLVLLVLWYLLYSNTFAAADESISSLTTQPIAIPVTLSADGLPTAVALLVTATATLPPTETPTPTPTPAPTRIPTGARINARYLNLRNEPGGDVLALLKEEDELLLAVLEGYARREGFFWREVELIESGERGWVAEDYITYYYD